MRRHRLEIVAVAACAASLGGLAGCEVFQKNELTQSAIANNVVGMQIGDFFDRYGRGGGRRENVDGTLEFEWQSQTAYTPPGPAGQDERVCHLHLTVDPKGRITVATIAYDAQGKVGLSRCREIFEGRSR